MLVKSLIWSTLLYGAESWTLKKSDEKVLQSFEIWVSRRVLRISWTERKTNKWVRERIGVKEEDGIVKQIKRRKLAKYMHWKRRPESIVTMSIEGEIMRKNKKGRRKIAWVDNIREWCGGMSMARNNAWERKIFYLKGAYGSNGALALK